MNLVLFLSLLFVVAVTARDADPGDKRVEEGSVSVDTDAKSSRQLDKRLNNVPTAPTAFDWRARGAVTPVKDQGQCNSSWAFAAVGSVEATNYFTGRKLVNLSAQQLIDCSASYKNKGCDGGSVNSAFQYIIDNGGIDSQDTYPYEATVGQCTFNKTNIAARIKSYNDVTRQSSKDTLLTAVESQPVAVTVDSSQPSFKNYTSGVYYEPLCSQTNLNHYMLVVGYGTNSQGEDYWIVKNSYGTGWGMDGYILMARNRDNNCGIASRATYPVP